MIIPRAPAPGSTHSKDLCHLHFVPLGMKELAKARAGEPLRRKGRPVVVMPVVVLRRLTAPFTVLMSRLISVAVRAALAFCKTAVTMPVLLCPIVPGAVL